MSSLITQVRKLRNDKWKEIKALQKLLHLKSYDCMQTQYLLGQWNAYQEIINIIKPMKLKE